MANQKFDPARRKKFIEALRSTANISLASRMAGISQSTARTYKAAYPGFSDEWDTALEEAADNLEQEARRRAMTGVAVDVYHQGVVVGTKTEYSDSLMALLLKAHKPEKYRERIDTQHSGGVTLNVVTGVPDA